MEQTPESGRIITRGGLAILSFQLAGLCAALQQCVDNKVALSFETTTLLKQLEARCRNLIDGTAIDKFPELMSGNTPGDLLVRANVLRFTLLSFLQPDELEEQRQAFGFNKN